MIYKIVLGFANERGKITERRGGNLSERQRNRIVGLNLGYCSYIFAGIPGQLKIKWQHNNMLDCKTLCGRVRNLLNCTRYLNR